MPRTTTKTRVLERDQHRCVVCGTAGSPLHAHHLLPASESGSNRLENLVTVCERCHQAHHGQGIGRVLYSGDAWSKHKLLLESQEQLAGRRKALKERSTGIWNSYSYQRQKWELDEQLRGIHRELGHLRSTAVDRLQAHAEMQSEGRLSSKQLPLIN